MAQLDSAAGFYPDGCRFESCRGRVRKRATGKPSQRRLGFKLGDASVGSPHDYGEGLRRINLDTPLTAHLAGEALDADGIDVRINLGGGGMLGQLGAPAHIVYAAEDEHAVLEVVADLLS